MNFKISTCDRCDAKIVSERSIGNNVFRFNILISETELETVDWTLCQTCQNDLVKFVEDEFDGWNPPDLKEIEYGLKSTNNYLSGVEELIEEIKEES